LAASEWIFGGCGEVGGGEGHVHVQVHVPSIQRPSIPQLSNIVAAVAVAAAHVAVVNVAGGVRKCLHGFH